MKLFGSAHRPAGQSGFRKTRLRLEDLEDRTLLSTSPVLSVLPSHLLYRSSGQVSPFGTSQPTGAQPNQVRHAYGFDQITFGNGIVGDGSGTTIAIVDAFDDPNIANDLHQFDLQFHLPDPVFTKVNQLGGTTYPQADAGWASEIALDVEWAHAVAPGAKILLVESTDSTNASIIPAVAFAARQPGVVAVSMSWGSYETSTETFYDSRFLTPAGHSNVTFVSSSGDTGAPASYPSSSPNVLSVGGTSLTVDSQGNYVSESAWYGSGGGISTVEQQPSYQHGVVTQSSVFRTTPDVAYDADPATGFPVYDSYNNGTTTPWSQFGGTSDASPQWAALIAIADQGRALAGKAPLDGSSQTLPLIYQLPTKDFHDITTGSSRGVPTYSAGPGYDLATGLGTPVANRVVADLVSGTLSTGPHFSLSTPSITTAGNAFSITVSALDGNNNPATGYTGTVHFTSSDGNAVLPANYTFTASDNGVHTFVNGVTLKKAGNDSITVSDVLTSTIVGTATVSITPASPNHVLFAQQPTTTAAGSVLSPAVTVQVVDLYNNVITSDYTDAVTLSLGSNPGNGTLMGTTTMTTSGGIATFNNLSINKTGSGYTLKATSGILAGAALSNTFTITPGKPTQLAFGQQPSNAALGNAISPAVTVQVLDANKNVVTSDNSDQVSLALSGNASGATLSGTLTVTVQNGVATFSAVSVSKSGTGFMLVASSGSLTGATSNTFTVSVASSSTALTASAASSVLGQQVTFTATVTGSLSGTPTGKVTFWDGTASLGQGTLTASNGATTTSFSTATLALGSHTITASYAGDGGFQSSSGTLAQTVGKASTSTVLVATANPSVSGQAVSFTVTLSVAAPGSTAVATPSGLVTFSDGSTSLGQGTLTTSGGVTTASFSTTTLSTGSHPLTASYAGDGNFLGSSGTLAQTVSKATTTTALGSSLSATVSGQAVNFTVTVTVTGAGSTAVARPTGAVSFYDGSTSLGQGTVATSSGVTTASFSTATLSVGSHTITASYAGDGNFLASSGSVPETVGKASTATAVAASVSPLIAGQMVTFVATVTVSAPGSTAVANPTGVVTFSDGSTSLGQGTLSTANGTTTASFTTSSLTVGSHSLTASYAGDGNFLASSDTLAQTVSKANTSIVLASASNPSTFAQSITFVATVTSGSPNSGTPTGTVQFQLDNTNVGSPVSVTTSSGVTTASFSTAALTVGTHTISASYSGDINFNASAASMTTQTVGKASTSTLLASSVSAAVAGQPVTFTATVSGASVPTGTVTFIDGSTTLGQGTLTTSGGTTTASFNVANLAVGSHTLTASYAGDGNFLASSGTLVQTVSKANTSTVVVAAANPSVSGQMVSLTVTLSVAAPGSTAVATPSGLVIISDGATSLGQGMLATSNGVTTASFTTAGLSTGSHTLTASYAGDGNFLASSDTLTQTINPASTVTALVTTTNSSVLGQAVTFTATVAVSAPGSTTVANPGGVVIFSDGNTSLGQGTLSTANGTTTASFTTSSLTVGSHSLTASYAGDGGFLASSGVLAQTIGKASTNTVLVATANPSVSGQAVSFTVTLSVAAPGSTAVATPSGLVTFSDGSTSLGQGTLTTSGGVTTASFSTTTLSTGSHPLTASYAGDGNFLGSSGTLAQTVSKATTTTALGSSNNPAVFGQTVTFTATLTVSAPGGTATAVPSGVVIFTDGATSLGQGPLHASGGVLTASFTTARLTTGNHTIAASYAGDGNFVGSASTVFQTVGRASTTTAIVSSMGPSVFGQGVSFTVVINVQSPGTTMVANPTGTVVFYDGATVLGQGMVTTNDAGVSTAGFSTTTLPAGTHTITASYSGDTNFDTSSSTLAGGQIVNQADTTTALTSSLNPSMVRQSVVFTASVAANSPGSGMPTGTVQFQVDGNNLGKPVNLSGGSAVSPAVTSLLMGVHTIRALYSGDNNFAASSQTLLQLVFPGFTTLLFVSGFPPSGPAGIPGSFSVAAQDADGDIVPSYRGTIHFASSDSQALLPADYTFTDTDNGVHFFSAVLTTAGAQSLTASDSQNADLSGSQAGIDVTPAAPDHLLVVSSVPATVAGMAFDVTVTIQDAYNNTVTNYTGTLTFSSADPLGATLPAAYTFTSADNGAHAFVGGAILYTAGTWDVTASDAATLLTGATLVRVTPAAAVQLRLTAPATMTATTPFDVTVTALDPYGNVASGYQGTVLFATSDPDPTVVLPEAYPFAAGDAGVHLFAGGVVLVTPGDQTLTIADANGLTASATVTITAPPGDGGGGALPARPHEQPFAGPTASVDTLVSVNVLADAPSPQQFTLSGAVLPQSPARRQAWLRIREAVDQLFAEVVQRQELRGVSLP